MNTAPIVQRLSGVAQGLRYIGGAMDLNEATLQAAQHPSAFVLPLGQTAAAAELIGVYEQVITSTWGIVIVLKSQRSRAGQDQSDELDTLRLAIRNALAGWSADPAQTTAMAFEGGELLALEAGLLVWQDRFVCDTAWRLTPP